MLVNVKQKKGWFLELMCKGTSTWPNTGMDSLLTDLMWLMYSWLGCIVEGRNCRQTSALIAETLTPVSTKHLRLVSQTVPWIETYLVSRDSGRVSWLTIAINRSLTSQTSLEQSTLTSQESKWYLSTSEQTGKLPVVNFGRVLVFFSQISYPNRTLAFLKTILMILWAMSWRDANAISVL